MFLGVKGRKCRVYEANYDSNKGEILALLYGLLKFDHLLRYKKFVFVVVVVVGQQHSATLEYDERHWRND